jgi:hypothetical protein
LLVRRVLLARPVFTLPDGIRRNLRRAILAGVLDLRDAPVFETATGTWIDLAAVQSQRELFGNLWAVERLDATPLDERRIVLASGQQRAPQPAWHPDDRGHERSSWRRPPQQMRAPVESLAVDVASIIREVDRRRWHRARGVIAVLAPNAATHRQLRLSRALHPFDGADDPCRWPTVAVIDDARFAPDRCWEHPERDDIYKAAIELLHRASNDALRSVVQPPANALASIRVAPWT